MPILDRILDPQFIEAISTLLWPLAVVVIALVYREQIKTLLSRITTAKLFGSEVTFSVQDLQATVHRVLEKSEMKPVHTAVQAVRPSPEPSLPNEVGKTAVRDIRESVTGQQIALLERPINGMVIETLYDKVEKEPLASVLLVSAQLEKSIISLLAAEGNLETGMRSNVRKLAHTLGKEKNLPSQFHAAVRKFFDVRNSVAHGKLSYTEADLAKVARSGIDLVELIERVPRDIIFVECAGLSVFADRDCTKSLPGYEAIVLLFAAIPGQTGARVTYLTNRHHYYMERRQVSSVWQAAEELPTECWVKFHGKVKGTKLETQHNLFIGRHIDEFVD